MNLDAVHPELRQFLLDTPTLTPDVVLERRADPVPVPPLVPDPRVAITERFVPGPPGAQDVRVLVFSPTARRPSRPAVLHVHGGGYMVGAPEMLNAAHQQLSLALDCVIVSVDYRLAPEMPYPGPLEDCYAALAWLHRSATALGVDRSRVAIKGESAGGGLASALALVARDRAEYLIAFQCLLYPMIDDRTTTDLSPHLGQFVWTAANNRYGWTCYLGREPGGADVPAYAAPARADDLRGLPPAWIGVAALDLFLPENLEWCRRLATAGVPVELDVYPGAYHGFGMAGDTSVQRRYERDVREALSGAFGTS